MKKNIFGIFWVVALAEVIISGTDYHKLHFFLKPLLMPLLILAVSLWTGRTQGKKKVIAALFFSFLGDVFLLYQDEGAMFFTLGLTCFLITHILYILYFMQLIRGGTSGMRRSPLVTLLIIVYTGSLLYILMPGLGDFKVPVIVYACIISTMLFFSLNLPYSVRKKAGYLFVTGALSFVTSDSLLAINKFLKAFPLASAIVMFTYCLAQYLIVKGFIRTAN